MKRLDPGELNIRINVKRYYYKRDDTGAEVQMSKQIVKNVWAKKEDLTGLEDEENGRVVSVAYTKFYIRHRREVLFDWKNLVVCYNDNEYNVIAIREIGRKDYIELKTVLRD